MDCGMPWTRSLPGMDSMGQLNIQNLSIHFHSREGIVQAVNDIDLKIKGK